MLVLSRRKGERIAIGDDIWLTVVSINPQSGKVRIGVSAPPHVQVNREEVLAAIQRESQVPKVSNSP